MQTITLIEIVAVAAAGGGFVIAWMALRRDKNSDNSVQAREMGTLLADINYNKSKVDGLTQKIDLINEKYAHLSSRVDAQVESLENQMTRKIENIDERHVHLSERIVTVEKMADRAHARMDQLKKTQMLRRWRFMKTRKKEQEYNNGN